MYPILLFCMLVQTGVSHADVDTKAEPQTMEIAADASPQKLVIKTDASEVKTNVTSVSFFIEADKQNTKTSLLRITIACVYPSKLEKLDREVQDLYLKLSFLKDHGYDCVVLTAIDNEMRLGKKPLPPKEDILIHIPLSKEKMPDDVLRGLVTVLKDHFYFNEQNTQQIREFLKTL